jgi:hypothetical protein
MLKRLVLSTVAATALLATPVLAQGRTEVGMLDCNVAGGVGLILGSRKEVSCLFKPTDASKPAEQYVGTVTRIGIDVGVTGKTVMTWLVVAPTSDPLPFGALAGSYVGASADASAAIGGGANVLIGGSNKTLTLQPLSVQAQTGLNVAVGVSEFTLRMAAG